MRIEWIGLAVFGGRRTNEIGGETKTLQNQMDGIYMNNKNGLYSTIRPSPSPIYELPLLRNSRAIVVIESVIEESNRIRFIWKWYYDYG